MKHILQSKKTASVTRLVILAFVLADIVMMGVQILSYPVVIQLPGGLTSAIQPAVLLVTFQVVIWIITQQLFNERQVLYVTMIGLATGLLETLHIFLEHYGPSGQRAQMAITLVTISLLFGLWTASGYSTLRNGGSIALGVLAGSISAMMCMIIVVTYGFSQLFWSLPELMNHNVGSIDLVRSGWTDMKAFTIADIFQAGFKVLFFGPIVGTLCGLIGGGLFRIRRAVFVGSR